MFPRHCPIGHGECSLGYWCSWCYFDDVGAFSSSWHDHLALLDTVLHCLCDNGFTVNPLKCNWAVQDTEWLGYLFASRGLKPWKKKINAILHMDLPCTTTDLCGFISCINFYCDMWPSHSHVLAPLTACSGLKKNTVLNWTPKLQQAFHKMHLLMTADTLSAYPDHNKWFDIYTDSSDDQMGACIMQEDHSIAYYSKKLNRKCCLL